MKRQLLPAGTFITKGCYALTYIRGPTMEVYWEPYALWLGGRDCHTRLYSPTGAEEYQYFAKGWGSYVRLMPLTDDEAARLLTAAKLLDLRDEAWTAYVTDFVSTLTNEKAPA